MPSTAFTNSLRVEIVLDDTATEVHLLSKTGTGRIFTLGTWCPATRNYPAIGFVTPGHGDMVEFDDLTAWTAAIADLADHMINIEGI